MVTLYRNNRLDGAEQHDPDQLAADFIATVKGEKNPEYKGSGRRNLEFEYRWFLSVGCPDERGGFTWDDQGWAALWEALDSRLDALDEDAWSEFIRVVGG